MSRSGGSATAGSSSGLTRGARVTLRPLADGDAVMRYEVVREADGAVIGVVECQADEPAAGWLTVGCIEVGEGWRGWGYGSEAVRLLEAAGKAERFRSDVDAGNGLALYFWLRLGYRPAGAGEVPGGAKGGMISMVRMGGEPRTKNLEP